ncbi:COX15/CtaA family protein [Anaerobacillus sp. MEB173]|uniref:COX15/CtaA family protein n=1 Tax=Anaerobacillus sp. MEB173 TaxID=3383345 RepID=UPI003F91B7B1
MRHRFALFTTVVTIIALLLGNLVVATNSGDACGTSYPKCNGVWIPDFTINVAIEYSHRVFTLFLGFFIFFNSILAWTKRYKGETGIKVLAPLTSFFLIFQALTGGLNVMLGTPPGFTTFDVTNSLLLLTGLIFLMIVLQRRQVYEISPELRAEDQKLQLMKLPSLIAFLFLYFEIILGAFFKHTGASKLAFDLPVVRSLFESTLIAETIYHFHGIMTGVVVVYAIWLLFYTLRTQMFVIPAVIFVALVLLNGIVGMISVYTSLPAVVSSIHMMLSVLTLASSGYILGKTYFGTYFLVKKD